MGYWCSHSRYNRATRGSKKQSHSSEWKADLKDLYITAAKEVEVGSMVYTCDLSYLLRWGRKELFLGELEWTVERGGLWLLGVCCGDRMDRQEWA